MASALARLEHLFGIFTAIVSGVDRVQKFVGCGNVFLFADQIEQQRFGFLFLVIVQQDLRPRNDRFRLIGFDRICFLVVFTKAWSGLPACINRYADRRKPSYDFGSRFSSLSVIS